MNPIYDTITIAADTDLTGITAVLLEVLPDPSLPKNGPGRWGQSGNFILDELSFAVTPLTRAGAGQYERLFCAGDRRLGAAILSRGTCDRSQSENRLGHRPAVWSAAFPDRGTSRRRWEAREAVD